MQEGQQPNKPGWVFKPGEQTAQAPESSVAAGGVAVQAAMEEAPQTAGQHIEWTASEYIASPKTGGWYVLLAVSSLVLAVAAFFVTGGDILSTAVIAILGILVGVFAARQPRTLSYRISTKGLQIGEKFYPFESFKSFSVANDQAMGFISLLPLKRFMPPLIVHYAPEDEGRIAQTLAEYLPYEDHKPDMIDSLTRKVRF